jgi:hypothetical protein
MRKCSTFLAPKEIKVNKIAWQDSGSKELLHIVGGYIN